MGFEATMTRFKGYVINADMHLLLVGHLVFYVCDVKSCSRTLLEGKNSYYSIVYIVLDASA